MGVDKVSFLTLVIHGIVFASSPLRLVKSPVLPASLLYYRQVSCITVKSPVLPSSLLLKLRACHNLFRNIIRWVCLIVEVIQ